MHYLNGITVLILGLGDSGLAMARWCARCGASVRVADTREAPPQAAVLREQLPDAELHHGLAPALLDGVNLVLKSPGLAPGDAALRPLLERADELGIPVRGELSLFATALADLKAERGYAPHVLAITGTNGKTTTTSLTAQLVERAGRRVGLAGNIGPTLLDTLSASLDLEPLPAPVSDEAPEAADVSVEEWAATQPEEGLGDDECGDEFGPAGDDVPAAPATPEPAEPAASAAARAELESVAAELPPAANDDEAPLVLAPPPPAAPVFEHLPEVWVLELSSFQLDGVSNFEPSAAVVLNVTQDHIDWHGSMEAYVAAKARIFGNQAVLVINRDDPATEAMIPPPEVIKAAIKGRPSKTIHRKVVRFGLDAPARPGDYGLVTEAGMAWLMRAMESDETIKRKRGEEEEIILQRLMPADALRIRGRHNAANALAALALATAIGCPLAPMLHGLREYRGEPHRVEVIGSLGGVDAVDDSKGTNVGATVAALTGLGADLAPGRLVVILGGDGKGQDFAPLVEPVVRHARAVALIGRDAVPLQLALQEAAGLNGVALQPCETLQAATRWAFDQARPGDAVLLSPACASLDMFRNYAHRAEVFAETVREIAAERGEVLA